MSLSSLWQQIKNVRAVQEMAKSNNEEWISDDKFSVTNLQFRKIINSTPNNKEKHREILVFLCFHSIIDLFVLASFLNTQHVFSQVAAFYPIWLACVFHDTLPQPPYL